MQIVAERELAREGQDVGQADGRKLDLDVYPDRSRRREKVV